MGVTIKDVANKTGVSIATVSLVLNNKAKKSRISEKTTKKIIEAANQMNYPQKNKLSESNNTIGIVTSVNFALCCSPLLSVIDATCRNNKYYYSFASVTNCQEGEEGYLRNFLSSGIAVVIVDPTFMNEDCTRNVQRIIEETELPRVYLGMINATLYPNSFAPNFYQAGVLCYEKSKESGVARIAVVTDELWSPVATKIMMGMKDASEEKNNGVCVLVKEYASPGILSKLSEKLVGFDGIFFLSKELLMLYISSVRENSTKYCSVLRYMNDSEQSSYSHSICLNFDWIYRKGIHQAINLLKRQDENHMPEMLPVLYR
ncbi:MAG: LacI family DNA-binding transcriptional regulator [Sphaerochaetaceae bacterium]